jgi:hypothetical protein
MICFGHAIHIGIGISDFCQARIQKFGSSQREARKSIGSKWAFLGAIETFQSQFILFRGTRAKNHGIQSPF